EQIEAFLKGIASANPDRVTTTDIGKSYEGRSIWMVTIKSGTAPSERSVIVDAGIHAREWIAPAVALYFIDMLIKQPEIAEGVEFRIIPVVNPDGYVYSHTSNRLWRKNRRITSNRRCRGVDLNRNWSYRWGEGGSSSDECSEIYRGTSAFSEPETRTPGLGLYPTSGTSRDWAFATLGANYSFTVELRDTGDNGFVLPSNQIKPTREENWEGFKYLIQIVKVT
ncbi:UNVERIFIED_CONTAM: hypothetical protein GTU68_013932, partial [Idotea baltica]|nr:hypothetical protein [Idotea baltica]